MYPKCVAGTGVRSRLAGMAQMLQPHFGICLWAALGLALLAGSHQQTDDHLGELTESNGSEKASIMLELLWEGIKILTNDSIRIQDEEVASLRPAKRLLQLFQHEIPKHPAGIEEHLDHLSQSDIPITAEEFEQLVFTAIYCAYQIRAIQGLEKNLWINLFSQSVTEIIRELCKQVCPVESMDSAQLLASRPWQEMPFYITVLKNSYHSKLTVN